MIYSIEVRQLHNEIYLHQDGFSLKDNEKEVVQFNTTVPGGFPYIMIKDGKNKGKSFIIDAAELQKMCEHLLSVEIAD